MPGVVMGDALPLLDLLVFTVFFGGPVLKQAGGMAVSGGGEHGIPVAGSGVASGSDRQG